MESIHDDLHQIQNCQFGLPTTWSTIPNQPIPSPDWPDQVAALLAEEGRAHKRLAKALRAGHAAIIDPPATHLMVGVWVPDRGKGEICGIVYADVLDADPEQPVPTREYYRSLVDPDRRTGITVFGRKLDELDLPAGPTLLAREIIGRPLGLGRKLIQHNVIYTFFPPGCSQALQITASTTDMPLGEILELDFEAAMPGLTVFLREPV